MHIPVTATGSLDTFALYGDKSTTNAKAGEITLQADRFAAVHRVEGEVTQTENSYDHRASHFSG